MDQLLSLFLHGLARRGGRTRKWRAALCISKRGGLGSCGTIRTAVLLLQTADLGLAEDTVIPKILLDNLHLIKPNLHLTILKINHLAERKTRLMASHVNQSIIYVRIFLCTGCYKKVRLAIRFRIFDQF